MSKDSPVKKIRTIFMGTPDFAVPGLKSLLEDDFFDLIAVYTKPDKAKGRNQRLSTPPIKDLALKHNISVFQPEKIKPEVENIKNLNPDLIVVIAYGKIIPQAILDIPKYGCINVHASLLPKYRGAACLNAPIIHGDKKTGITIMKMDAGMDTGPILKQAEILLHERSTLPEVHDKLSQLGADTLPNTIKEYLKGNILPQKQDHESATYVSLIKKEDGKINWHEPAKNIEQKIRGLNPWPGTYSITDKGKMIKILEAEVDTNTPENETNSLKIGQIFKKNRNLGVHCGQDNLIILKLQTEGKRAMSASEFLSGHQDIIGQILE